MDLEKALLLLSKKPELVNDFPEWMLPSETIAELRKTKQVVIAEIAGRDSFAALLQATDQLPISAVLPTIAYTGTEYGDWETQIEKSRHLSSQLGDRGIKVFDPILLGSPPFWWQLCGRPIVTMLDRFGFYTPCIGCHLYLHALRLPLAKSIGARIVISGERETHDGRVKLSQIGVALDAYIQFMRDFGVELALPLRDVRDGEEVERILGEGWQEGAQQLQCVLSKNYQRSEGSVTYDEQAIRRFLAEFALPLAREFLMRYSQKS